MLVTTSLIIILEGNVLRLLKSGNLKIVVTARAIKEKMAAITVLTEPQPSNVYNS